MPTHLLVSHPKSISCLNSCNLFPKTKHHGFATIVATTNYRNDLIYIFPEKHGAADITVALLQYQRQITCVNSKVPYNITDEEGGPRVYQ